MWAAAGIPSWLLLLAQGVFLEPTDALPGFPLEAK